MRLSRVRQRWAEDKPVLCAVVHITDPSVCELVSLMGFDCIWIDMEHHPTSLETAGQMMRAARVGSADVMARPGKGEFMRMARMLEAGATGIIYPRCDNAAEAAEVVRWAKFAPLGQRGYDGSNPDNPYGTMEMARYVREANEQTFVAIQIESPAAVQQARAIAEVQGVDMLFFGPGDFSVLSGAPGQFGHEKLLRAVEAVCKAALTAGKRFGTICLSPEQDRRMLELGATFLAYASDMTLLRKAYEGLQRRFRPLGFGFDSRLS